MIEFTKAQLKSVVLAAAAIGISGCTSTGTVDQTKIDQVQQLAVIACGFLPTVETVANLISPGVAAVPSAIAQAICDAVRPTMAAAGRPRMGAPGATYVGKVKVEGQFVR